MTKKELKRAMEFGFDPSFLEVKTEEPPKKKLPYPVVPRPQSLYKLMRSNQPNQQRI